LAKYDGNPTGEGGASFLKLPRPFKVKSEDVDVGSGYRKVRHKLEKKKTINADIKRMEEELSRNSLGGTTNIQEFIMAHNKHKELGQSLRLFYQRPICISQARHLEIQNHRFRNHLCANERKFIISEKG
jgi:peptide methionine sulfoxide reductase MsrA